MTSAIGPELVFRRTGPTVDGDLEVAMQAAIDFVRKHPRPCCGWATPVHADGLTVRAMWASGRVVVTVHRAES